MNWPTTTRLRLEEGIRILGHVDGVAFARTGGSYARLEGPSAALLCALQKPRSLGSLLGPAQASVNNAELRWQLERLVDAGYVRVEAENGNQEGDAETQTSVSHRRPTTSVLALADTHESLERAVQAALERAGTADLRAVSLDHYLAPRGLEPLCEPASPPGGVAWLPIAVFDAEAWFGPILVQPGGPCPQCLHTRLWHNHPVERFLAARGVAREQLFPVAPVPVTLLERALSWLERRLPGLLSARASGASALQRVDFRSGRESQHMVQRRPQCPRCGDGDALRRQMLGPPRWRASSSAAERAEPVASDSIVSRDGGLRTLEPELTHRRLALQVDPLVGRVGSLGQELERSNAYHQLFSAAYQRVPQPGEELAVQGFSVLSAGKGRSPVQARTSALCEALERQCAQCEGDEARRSASYRELCPDAVDPRALLLFSDAQYRAGTPKQQRLHKSPRSQYVPAPFDVDEVLNWSPVWSLSGAHLRWVPTQYCLDGTFVGSPTQSASCAWDSNGCAAGNTLAEATLQGLLELVERDAVAIWWYNCLSMPSLSLENLSSTASRLVARHERLGRKCWALDLTHDLGIPVAAVVLEEMSSGGFVLGFGCHPLGEIALERAVLEIEQVLDGESEAPRLFTGRELDQDRFLLPTATRARAPRLIFTEPATEHDRVGELESILAGCVERLCTHGLEPLLFNYSRPDVALHTVKVLVPGLRHFWPRYAPGRLFQVPVQMGWSPAPLAEAELNPLPLLM